MDCSIEQSINAAINFYWIIRLLDYCHCSVIVIGFIKSIFKYNYQFMSIFNILILMVFIDCVGVSVGVSVGGVSVFNILISSI